MSDFPEGLAEALAGRYTLERELGRGGMAIVYLARDKQQGRHVALKVLRPELSATIGHERFLAEIEMAAGFVHPHILPLHDSGPAAGMLYYTMPHVSGESLRDRLGRERRLAVREAVRIVTEVASALDYAHGKGVIHRDIKPENILLVEGHAVVSDFGIARALSAGRRTGTGVVIGSPDYMSPEQAEGSDTVDQRTDVYSLGCVLFEMLSGRVPRAITLGAAISGEGAGKSPGVSLSTIPLAVEAVVLQAIAVRPQDRYASAGAFGAALTDAMRTGGWSRRARRIATVGLVTAAAAVATWGVLRGDDMSHVDPDRYVIIPFSHSRGAAPTLVDGELCARLLYQGFAQWADVQVTEPLRVNDALHRLYPGAMADGGPALSLKDGTALARDLGAGRLVLGELWQFLDTTFVRASVYDVTDGAREVASRGVRLAKGMSEGAVFYALADSLLFAGEGARVPLGAPSGRATTSTRALVAHEDGHKALDVWDLERAADGFRRAVRYDSAFAHALLELAQVKAWQQLPPETWRDTAARAARMTERLAPRERLLARALEAMGAAHHDEACARYQELLTRDSLDATAWYGLGECRARDRVVLHDPRSPSGWGFRGSYHAATLAYRRALDLAPSLNLLFRGQVYAHLAELLFTEAHRLRSGRPLPPDTGLFAAYADIQSDTLAFIPYRLMPLVRREHGGPPRGPEATVRMGALLGEIVSRWVRAFPQSAEAHDAMAQWLEGQGHLGSSVATDTVALSEIRAARRLASDSAILPLAISETRILIKLGEFGAARLLADSLLDAASDPDPATADALSGVAVLTGRPSLAAQLLRRAAPRADPATLDGRTLGAPPPVLEGIAPFIAYASVGAPAESVRLTMERAESLIRAWIPPARQSMAREALLLPSLRLVFHVVGPTALHREHSDDYLIELQTLLARGDSAAVRSRWAAVRQDRQSVRAGEIAIDGIYEETVVLLALGDTAGAREHLDWWFAGLALSRRSLLWQPTQAGALVRAMALRAELASRAGDRPTARRWAANVIALWSDADPEVQFVVARMRRM